MVVVVLAIGFQVLTTTAKMAKNGGRVVVFAFGFQVDARSLHIFRIPDEHPTRVSMGS